MGSAPRLVYSSILRNLGTIPGVDKTTARVIVAELGTDMAEFPSASHDCFLAALSTALHIAGEHPYLQRGYR
jgi:hypothetical protein